jgi:Fic family protein
MHIHYQKNPLGFPVENVNFPMPYANTKQACFVCLKNLPSLVWNAMTVLERNPTTLPQTETILKGRTVAGLSIDQMMQVKRFGDAMKTMVKIVQNGNFSINLKTACMMHEITGAEEALEWGVLRKQQVHISNVDYIPPAPEILSDITNKGFETICKMNNPLQQAISTFMFISKTQCFFDANKRTASVMMNGILLSNGIYPLMILQENADAFDEKIKTLYDYSDPNPLIELFEKTSKQLYPNKLFITEYNAYEKQFNHVLEDYRSLSPQ